MRQRVKLKGSLPDAAAAAVEGVVAVAGHCCVDCVDRCVEEEEEEEQQLLVGYRVCVGGEELCPTVRPRWPERDQRRSEVARASILRSFEPQREHLGQFQVTQMGTALQSRCLG